MPIPQRHTAPTMRQPTERAPATLIFVPGLGHDLLNSAEVVAKSVAAQADAYRPDSVRAIEDVPPATAGLRAVRTLVDGEGRRLLDVTELDYREALESLVADDGREGVAPGLIRQGYYSVIAAGLWFRAIGQPGKTRQAKLQAGLGTAAMLIMIGAFLITLIGVVCSTVSAAGLGWVLPGWTVDSAPWVALSGGLVSAATLARFRTGLLRSSRRLHQLIRYFEEEAERVRITRTLDTAVDKLRESGYTGKVHVLAYSFGSIVTLDCFTTNVAGPDGPDRVFLSQGVQHTDSISTIGCPLDLVTLYAPRRYDDVRPLRPDLPWHNVFVASDIFASNFHPVDDTADQPNEVLGGWRVANHRYLPQEQLTFSGVVFRGAGLRNHNVYWDELGGCWEQGLLVQWGLLPAPVVLSEPQHQPA
jgi:hypothetical protein